MKCGKIACLQLYQEEWNKTFFGQLPYLLQQYYTGDKNGVPQKYPLCVPTCGNVPNPTPAATPAPAPIILRAFSSLFFRRSADVEILQVRAG